MGKQAVKVTFTIDLELLAEFDETVKKAHYSSRSAAIHEAMRDLISKVKKRG